VTGWQWSFGDGTSSTVRNPTHAYGTGGTYGVTLTATDNGGATGSKSAQVTVSGSTSNAPPVADFTSSCSGLTCGFTDRSTDTDGSVVGWSWAFGDGSTSTARNPSRTYAAGGTYSVTLTVTDDGGATQQRSGSVTVPASSSIVLNVSGRVDATRQYMALTWTGASGTTVNVFRNGPLLTNTENDGKYTNSRAFTGSATYTYKICQVGSSVCSNEATVTFP